jgi:site-specific recombinase XerD
MGNELYTLLIPREADKDRRSRLKNFVTWLIATDGQWNKPDLLAYRDYLLVDHCSNSVTVYLATIRGRYRELAGDFLNAADPDRSKVKQEIKQDRVDSRYAGVRLTSEQAEELLSAPGSGDLLGIRNTALIAVSLYTGIREQELCNLEIRDLRQTLDGDLCLHVREGKGCMTRAIPYGAGGVRCLSLVDKWTTDAGITVGLVFRPLWKSHRLRPGKLSTRTVQKTMTRYPIMIDDVLTHVRHHDLRRTYARRCYDEGMDPISIQKNLGHATLDATLLYIGLPPTGDRNPPELYKNGGGTSE